MKIRTAFVCSLYILIMLSQVSCATKHLYSTTIKYTDEEVKGFYMSSDEKLLVVIGKIHHYVFPLDSKLKSVLAWENKSKINVTFDQFYLTSNSIVSGAYILQTKLINLNDTEQAFLRNLGFVEKSDSLLLSQVITGRTYNGNNIIQASSFNKTYSISLRRDTTVSLPLKLALTPVTIALDGAMVIGVVTLLSIMCLPLDIVKDGCFPGGL